jgi:hypothetical protein
MIFFNDEQVMPNGTRPIDLEYFGWEKSIKEKFKFPITLRDKRGQRYSDNGIPLQNGKISFVPSGIYKYDFGTYNVIYSRTRPQVVKGEYKYPDNRILFSQNMSINESELELLYVIIKVLNGLNGMIEIEDRQLEAINLIDKEAKDADVKFYLLSQRSPLNQDDIRKIARSLGLHTNGLTLEQIKTATYNFIKGNNKYADFDNIINKLSSKEDIIKSDVVELMENGAIELVNDQYKIKETKEVLFDVYNEDKGDSLTALAKHLEVDKDKLEKVNKLVKRGRKPKE